MQFGTCVKTTGWRRVLPMNERNPTPARGTAMNCNKTTHSCVTCHEEWIGVPASSCPFCRAHIATAEADRLLVENRRVRARIHWAGKHPLALPPSEDDKIDGLDRLVAAMHLRDEEIEQLRQENAQLRLKYQ